MKTFEGVYPILLTTFDECGELDLESQARLIEHLLDQGAHGLGLFGNAGEGYALTVEERSKLMRLAVRVTGGRAPLIASSGHTSTWGAVELSVEMRDLGADALMVLPPYLLRTDGEGLMEYYGEIGRAAGIPVMVQDAPLMTGVAMPAGLLARMAREIPEVTMAKVEAPPTAPKVTEVLNLSGGELTAFGGLNAQFLIEEHQRGARGTMPGSDCIAGLVSVWNALERGDLGASWDGFARLLPLLRFQLQPGLGVSAMKHNLMAAGIIQCAAVRRPTGSLTKESLAELGVLRDRAR